MAIPVIFFWSAGKDSALGLWTIPQDSRLEVQAVVTTLTDTYGRVSISGVREELLDDQVARLGLPLVKVWIPPVCPNDLYEDRVALALQREPLRGIRHVAFGDIYLAQVRRHREERLAALSKVALFPVWGRDTFDLANRVLSAGFRATVVCVDRLVMPTSFDGRSFDARFLADLLAGVDPCGENGEFHTFVWDAPMYSCPVDCRTGHVVTRGNFDYCDFATGPGKSDPPECVIAPVDPWEEALAHRDPDTHAASRTERGIWTRVGGCSIDAAAVDCPMPGYC